MKHENNHFSPVNPFSILKAREPFYFMQGCWDQSKFPSIRNHCLGDRGEMMLNSFDQIFFFSQGKRFPVS